MTVRKFVASWWKVVGLLCVLPTMAVMSVGFTVVPKLPRCIGASRKFYQGIRECSTEIERRRDDQRASMLTGRILLRTFILCADLPRLKRETDESCRWIVGEKDDPR